MNKGSNTLCFKTVPEIFVEWVGGGGGAPNPKKSDVIFLVEGDCCVVVTMEVEVTSLQGMMGILRNSCIRKKDGGEVSYSGCDAKNRNDSY